MMIEEPACRRNIRRVSVTVLVLVIASPAMTMAEREVHPELWPEVAPVVAFDPAIETRVDALLQQMTLAEKVGQIIQADIAELTPDDVRQYNLGSILNGGNSGPGGDDFAPPDVWLQWADSFHAASIDTSDGGVGVPVIWGADAVHGNNNIIGATLFPHNIGLGAANNPELIEKIGEVTAIETRITGQDWTFGPTLAVVRDDRWGRTYESYSEDPELVARYAGRMVTGLQGRLGTEAFLDAYHVLSTPKHFLGDGGTDGGIDQGDNRNSEAELAAIHGAGYPPALQAGAQSVMASFSSWHGDKLHGHFGLLTTILKSRMNFGGFIVGDWDGHGQVDGCSKTNCPQSLHAGLDLYMAPNSWKGLYQTTLAQAQQGALDLGRLDDAVRRVLRVKFGTGLMDAPKPSQRPLSGQWQLLGGKPHRAIARQAVRESLVLLKNSNQLLPLAADSKVLVVGNAADDIARQSGGWTITWQGTGVGNEFFPNATSILAGITHRAQAAGGQVEHSTDGQFATRPDVAIVVFGEKPYAEFQGDIETLDFSPGDEEHLVQMQTLKAEGIPVIAVFLSGRPMWVNPELNAADAFVAAWLPGSEGGGIADVLFRDSHGAVRNDFTGRLSFSWPATPDHFANNGQPGERPPLFPLGYGLRLGEKGELPTLDESMGAVARKVERRVYFSDGVFGYGWSLGLHGDGGTVTVSHWPALEAGVRISAYDRDAQEDSLRLQFSDQSTASVGLTSEQAIDLQREVNGQVSLLLAIQVASSGDGPLELIALCGDACQGRVNLDREVMADGAWRELKIPLRCFQESGAAMNTLEGFMLRASGSWDVRLSELKLATGTEDALTCQ